jgi:hypothetical protein
MAQTDHMSAVPMTNPESPDWDTIPHEVHCPLCEYNLRGIRDPRCPECGYRFEWPDMLSPRRADHPYLFEHHPERNFRLSNSVEPQAGPAWAESAETNGGERP